MYRGAVYVGREAGHDLCGQAGRAPRRGESADRVGRPYAGSGGAPPTGGCAMGSLRQDLLAAAQAAVHGDLLRRMPFLGHARSYGVVLGGSGVTDDIDEYSGCDLMVFRFGRPTGAKRTPEARPARTRGWIDVRRPPHLYRYTVLDFEAFAESVARGEDEALYLVRHGQVLHDPHARLHHFWGETRLDDPAVWHRKLAQRYRAFRQRRASLAWSLRRGQPVQVLDNLRLLLEHALSCCYYLEGRPAPPRKWIFRGGLRTAAGRALREPVLELLSSLGDLATLGGSLNLHHNRIYRQVGRLQGTLEAVLVRAGLPVPGLATQATAVEADAVAPTDPEAGESRAPRARSGRRGRRPLSGLSVEADPGAAPEE